MPSPARFAQRRRLGAPARNGVPAAVLAFALAALAGCARAPVPPAPPAPPPPPRPHPGYDARRDSLDAVDVTALRGRRIVLDPGHGGSFTGATGVHGLTEAAVNLDVALELRRLLEAQGAEVLLTREADRDFLSPADSSLRADLAERMRIANRFGADLFVSIHHNADARGAHDVNEIQTYYRTDDEGPSLEAARAVYRYLVRNLSIERYRIVPGNYYVLRTSECPAILTESSYLTDPDVEERLALPEKRRLEAEALYLGIAAWCAQRAPAVEWLRAAGPAAAADTLGPVPALAARVRGAFDRVRMTVDGEPVRPDVLGDSVVWRANRPLAGGSHVAVLSASLAGAGTSPARRLAFRVAADPARLVADFPGQPAWDGRQPLAMRVRAFEASGLLHRDSIAIRVRAAGTAALAPRDTLVIAHAGVAWAYFRPARGRPGSRTAAVAIRATTVPVRPGASVTGSLAYRRPADGASRVRAGFARLEDAGTPLAGAAAARDDDPVPAWINRDGFVALPADAHGRVALPALPGYRPTSPDTAWPPRFVAIAGGALAGRRIAIDPEGGGDDPAGAGPSGTRASDLNLEVARALASFLEAAGAEALLVRDGDRALADLERVRRAEAFRPERYLRIGHRAAPPLLGHWIASVPGRAWAEHAREALGWLGLPQPPIAEEAQYALQQSSAAALYVSTARVDSATDEDALLAPGRLRAEAYAMYLALLREFAPAAVPEPDSLALRDSEGRPLPGGRVVLGGLVLEADRRGAIRFARTEPGPLDAALVTPGGTARRILLDSERGIVLTGPSGP